MQTLHIVTPCSRPDNLRQLYGSIKSQRKLMTRTRIVWWIFFDSERPNWECIPMGPDIIVTAFPTFGKGVVGHDQRNAALDLIMQGSIYFLDDDNILHPEFYQVEYYIREYGVIVFNQIDKEGRRRLTAAPENVRVGGIDTASFIISAADAVCTKFPLVYEGDGLFISDIYQRKPSHFKFLNKDLSYYNFLR